MYTRKQQVKDCMAAERVMRRHFNGLDHEEVWCIFLTSANTVITKEMLSKGTLTKTIIDNRTVMRRALLNNAAAIILLHNHPSGNPMPSPDDIRFTSGLKKACDLMGINLLDHIIIADGEFFSFSEDRTFNN